MRYQFAMNLMVRRTM